MKTLHFDEEKNFPKFFESHENSENRIFKMQKNRFSEKLFSISLNKSPKFERYDENC